MPIMLKISLTARNANFSFIFSRGSPYTTMIAYGVYIKMTTKVSIHQYDIGVKGQGQMHVCLK